MMYTILTKTDMQRIWICNGYDFHILGICRKYFLSFPYLAICFMSLLANQITSKYRKYGKIFIEMYKDNI